MYTASIQIVPTTCATAAAAPPKQSHFCKENHRTVMNIIYNQMQKITNAW